MVNRACILVVLLNLLCLSTFSQVKVLENKVAVSIKDTLKKDSLNKKALALQDTLKKNTLYKKVLATKDTLKKDSLINKSLKKRGFVSKLLNKDATKKDTTKKVRSEVVIEARKAIFSSAIVPGLGQFRNILNIKKDKERLGMENKNFALKKIFISAKIVGIYTAEVLLVRSYIQNRNDYSVFLHELQYRALNNGVAPKDSKYAAIETSVITAAKDNAARNREVTLFGMIGVHAINMIDAYIDARLRFFNVDDNLSFKIAPTIIFQQQGYAMNTYPAIKFTLLL